MNQQEQDTKSPHAELTPLRCAYFHYVTPGSTLARHHHGFVETYVMQEGAIGESDKLEQLIPVWAQKVKNGEIDPAGWAFGDVRWRRESYLVVVLDAPGFKFGNANALTITDGDHTFGKKQLIDIRCDDGTAMQAIYCINHFKNKVDGKPLPDGKSEQFKIKLDITPVTPAGADTVKMVTHDDVGTNIGPRRP